MTRALGGRRTHGLVPTKDALYLAELQGHGLAGTTRTCDPRLRRAVLLILLSCGEMVSTAGVEPAPSGFVDRRPDPLGHVDKCSPTDRMGGCAADGSCTRDLRLDRPALRLAELRRQMVRALGLEPSLIRGKGPVPYQSGVTRIGGPGRNRTPCVGRRLVYSQLRPMARPTHGRGQMGAGPDDDAYAVVKVPVAGLDARQAHARKESNLRPAVLETAAPPWLERKRDDAHDVVRGVIGGGAAAEREAELPARVGPAGIGRFPTPRPLLMIERLAG